MFPNNQEDATVPPSGAIGNVQTKYATLFEPPEELTFQVGARLGPTTVAYETYGTLNEQRDNAVFICHALTGDAHAAGFHGGEEDEKPGWWDGFIGPGKGIDTNRYFVICANVLGAAVREQPDRAASIQRPEKGFVLNFRF